MGSIEVRISSAVNRIIAANQKYFELEYDDDAPQILPPPATENQLHALESSLGRPLPPTFRAFLALHDGWLRISGNAMILPTGEREQAWVARRIDRIREHFREFHPSHSLDEVFFLMLGEDEKDFAYFDMSNTSKGELEVVYADLDDGEIDRFPDFAAFLEDMAETAELTAEEAG